MQLSSLCTPAADGWTAQQAAVNHQLQPCQSASPATAPRAACHAGYQHQTAPASVTPHEVKCTDS